MCFQQKYIPVKVLHVIMLILLKFKLHPTFKLKIIIDLIFFLTSI